MGVDESELKDLAIQKAVIQKPSPLATIKQKEIEINTHILKAKKQAEEKVAEARRKAGDIRNQAEKKGIEDAKLFYKEQITEAKKEAEKIKKTARVEVASANKNGEKNKQKAIRCILDAMLS